MAENPIKDKYTIAELFYGEDMDKWTTSWGFFRTLLELRNPQYATYKFTTDEGNPIMSWINELYPQSPTIRDYEGISAEQLDSLYYMRSSEKTVSRGVYKKFFRNTVKNSIKNELAMVPLVGTVARLYAKKWRDIFETLTYDYNPIENYNMTETESVDSTLTHGETVTGSSTQSNIRSGSIKDTHGNDTVAYGGETETIAGKETETYNNVTDTHTFTNRRNTETYTGESETTYNNVQDQKQYNNVADTKTYNNLADTETFTAYQETHEVSAYNDTGYAPSDRDTKTGSRSNTRSGTETDTRTGAEINTRSGSESMEDGGEKITAYAGEEADIRSGSVEKSFTGRTNTKAAHTDNYTYGDKTQTFNNVSDAGTGSSTETHGGADETETERTLNRAGNIGVTTTQQMIDQQRQLLLFDFFNEIVFPDIDKVVTLSVY